MSRTFYIAGAGFAVALFLGALAMPPGVKQGVRETSAGLLSPIWRVTDGVREGWSGFTSRFRDARALAEEVTVLRVRNAELETAATILAKLQEENDSLREMLGFRRASRQKLVPARVVGRDVSNWWNSVVINRGFGDEVGIEPDMPVVTPRGVVGKIGTVGRYTSQVILLVDENCRISAITESSRARGIVQGSTLTRGGDPACRLLFVERGLPFARGERVFTTGLGGTFPPNLLIGTVSDAPPLSMEKNFGL
jgi:rod shape-determining protein MreC